MSLSRCRRLFAWLALVALLVGAARPLVVQALRDGAPDFAAVLCSSAGNGAERDAMGGGNPASAHGHDLCCLASGCAPALPATVALPHPAPALTHATAGSTDAASQRTAPWTRLPSRGPPVLA